jgi:hypothetical protein
MSEDPTNPPPPENTEPTPQAGRRSLLRAAAWGGGIAGLGGLAGFAASRIAKHNASSPQARPPLGDEFTYDVARFQKSDPSLIRYEETGRFTVALERARNIAVANDGSIFVCGTGGIRKFTPKGESTLHIPLEQPVYSLAIRPSGEIRAGQAGKITVFSPNGVEMKTWSGFSAKFLPTSITITKDRVFVADAGERVVLQLDADGKQISVIGAKDPERNIQGFMIPSPYFCVRMAPDGLLRVTNPGEHLIEAYTTNGDREIAWGKSSFAIDGFCGCCNPVSFDIFPDGSFVTCEKGLPRVKLYDSHGTFTGLVAGPEAFPEYLKAANAGTPHSLGSGIYAAIDPQGRVLVLDVVGGEVRIMKPKD